MGKLQLIAIFENHQKHIMARTPSNMLPLGTTAPEFSLRDTVSNKAMSFNDIKGSHGTVVFFICNHCPFVIHVNDTLVALANEFSSKGIGFVGVSSNDVENYPQDGPAEMKAHAAAAGYPFPYLYDETQEVAKAYDAACTPDIYLFDNAQKLVYRGQLDDSRPGNHIPSDGSDLKAAISALLKQEPPLNIQKPSIGCNIKWKS